MVRCRCPGGHGPQFGTLECMIRDSAPTFNTFATIASSSFSTPPYLAARSISPLDGGGIQSHTLPFSPSARYTNRLMVCSIEARLTLTHVQDLKQTAHFVLYIASRQTRSRLQTSLSEIGETQLASLILFLILTRSAFSLPYHKAISHQLLVRRSSRALA
jgi:hypothetical protein